MQNILITGGNGFIGSRLIASLLNENINIISPTSKECDLRDIRNCDSITKNIDIVVHLAAHVGGLAYNQSHPAEIFYNNVSMSLNLLESCQRNNVKKFIGIGSVRSYPLNVKYPLKESSIWDGPVNSNNSAYAHAKRLMIVQSQFYEEQYAIKCNHLIVTNTYGPGMRMDDRITGIAAIVKKVIEAKKTGLSELVFWGTGRATRDFIYIDDVVNSILSCIFVDIKEPVLNIGSGTEISIKEIVTIICNISKYTGNILWDESKPEGELRSVLDTSLAESNGIRPQFDITEGLERTINWYEKL